MSGLYNQLQKIQRSMLEQSVQDDLSSVAQNASQISDITINVSTKGAKGDWNGTTGTDDSVAIQNAINALTTGGKVEFERGKQYLVTQPIYIYNSNIKIDLKGATIVWNGTANLNNSLMRYIGVFNFWGSATSTTANITSFTPNTYLQNPYSNEACFVTVDNPNVFNEGDWVELSIDTGTNTDTVLYPKVKVMTKIVKKDASNNIYLAYTNPWNFNGLTLTGTLTKVTPIFGNEISNVNINDIVPVTSQNGNTTNPYDTTARNTFVSGVSFQYAVDCKVENLYGQNTKFPLVMTNDVFQMSVKNVELFKPAIYGPGEGYLCQFNSVLYTTIENTIGTQERHHVDCTASAFIKIKNAKSFYSLQNSFLCHGKFEHDIEYDTCEGFFGFGSVLADFGNAGKNIRMNHVKGTISYTHVEDLYINKSDVILVNFQGYSTVIEKSQVKLYRGYALNPSLRGLNNASIKFVDCDLYNWNKVVETSQLIFQNYNTVTIERCTYDITNKSGISNVFQINGVQNIIIKDCPKLTSMYLDIYATSIAVNMLVISNKFSDYIDESGAIIIKVQNLTSATFNLVANNNLVKYDGTVNFVRFTRIVNTTTLFSDCTLSLNIVGNALVSAANMLSLYIDKQSTITRNVYANLFKGTKFEAIASTDVPNNTIA